MDFLLQHFLPYLLLYKYITLAVVTFLAAAMLPIPSGSLLMAASAFASQGYFKIGYVLLIAVAANILGDSTGYFLASYFGKTVLKKIGFRRILESPTFKQVEIRIQKKPGAIIFFSRFEVLMTLSVNLLSGVSSVTYRRYLLFEVLGTITQVCFYASIGYFFGSNWESVNSVVGKLLLVIVFVVIFFAVLFGKKKAEKLAMKEE